MPVSLAILPPRSAPPKDLEVRPKQVKAWLETLPLAQTIDAARKMASHLGAVNRAKIGADDRVQILESYRPLANTVLEELDGIFGKSAMPLGPRGREALSHARSLSSDLAAGYRIAITEKSGKLIAFGAKKQQPLLALRAMEYLGTELRASYKAYSPVPQGLWQAMHEIYLYSDSQGFAGEPADPETKASIAEVYAESLLAALTDPYRLSQGELDRVLALIRSIRAPVPLSQSKPSTSPNAHFLVPCDTDKPPKPALSASDDRGGPSWRLLDANPLVEKLRARKAAIEKGQISAAMAKSLGADATVLLSKLIQLWGDPPKRASRRDPMESTVAICVGLKAVSHYVALEPKIDPLDEADKIRRGITIPLAPLGAMEASPSHPVSEWEVVNQSTGGLKVRRLSRALQPVSVGELVGVKLIGRSRWTVGMVRWITVLEEGGMEFGIQFLASAARPVAIRPTISSSSTEPRPALILSEALPWRGGETLIAGSNTFSDLREFEVEDSEQLFNVRATNLYEKTGRYEIFDFAPS